MTVITSEDDEREWRKKEGIKNFDKYMGLQGIDATTGDALEIFYEVREGFSSGQLKFEPSSKISII